jgi:sigma-54 specific flagellar transcriptional regulator A
MLEHTGMETGQEVLVVDNNYTRGQSFLAVLSFIKLEAKLVTPEQLINISSPELFSYLAIFSIEKEDISSHFLKRNKEDKCQYPVVLMVDRAELTSLDIIIRLPYISGLCIQSDYYSLSQVLEQARVHNKRERRMHNRECQPLIGCSNAIERINLMIGQVADSNASVLLLGDSGTGKEVIARNIHARSSRSDKPFVPINCSRISAESLENELSSHEKSAYTGAGQGLFELAEGGVVFLDEIADLALPMQGKLLKVLQKYDLEKAGNNQSMKTDVRIIAATHRRLEGLIDEGKFDKELFYHLNVFPIEVPLLRERKEDIHLLVQEMTSRLEKENRGSVRLSKKAISMLQHYRWPGNVRELANLIERLAILYPHGVVDSKDLPDKYRIIESPRQVEVVEVDTITACHPSNKEPLQMDGIDMKQYLNDIEISLIKQALSKSGNVVARAASMLNIRRTTLVEKMRKYEIERIE